MQRILIVDDSRELLEGLEVNLLREGYAVLKATRGDVALKMAVEQNPTLIVLDVMLPRMSGFDVCRELRRRGIEAPVIMLTARGEEVDRVAGLEIGADDYVTKPFSVRELIARIGAHLRRQAKGNGAPERCSFDDLEIDFDKLQCALSGNAISLTAREFEILRLLIRHRGEVVSRERILTEVCDYDSGATTRTVDTHIARIRRKLEPDAANPRYIMSVYGAGYKFVG